MGGGGGKENNMSTLEKLQAKAKRKMKKDPSMLACELHVDKIDGEFVSSVKVYRYSEVLLNSQPETDGLLVNGSRSGRPIKYPFSSLGIGESFIMKKPLHKCNAYSRYWAKKTGRVFKMNKETKNTTKVERIS